MLANRVQMQDIRIPTRPIVDHYQCDDARMPETFRLYRSSVIANRASGIGTSYNCPPEETAGANKRSGLNAR
jgi:hypothetical protein